jgi:CheY-like chemotaxis protein
MVRILLVEDQPHNMRLIEQIIEDLDESIQLITAVTGLEALSKAMDNEFDMILMDIALPDMDGMKVTKAIREYPQHKDVPVIAVTAYAAVGEKEAFKEIFNGYVSKPIDENILSAAIRKWIGDKLK